MEDIFILPGTERELFDRYFDNDKYGELKERLELVRQALHNTLPPAERNKHWLNVDVRELLGEKESLKKKMFQAALRSFAEQVCCEQRALCELGFWQAPCGEEAGYILLCAGAGPCNGCEAVQGYLPLVGEAVRCQETEGRDDV